ncbi:MAG: universal stress protein [Thaumarchaeota archaeon]|nr:universal stress protein [Nitrososphaerota archaeon]
MIKHIMIPYDQSEPASRALEFATDLAIKYDSKISIVTCIVPQVPMNPVMSASYAETLVSMRKNAADAVSEIESKIKGLGIPAKAEILEGVSVSNELLSYAESHQVDLIVMGSRGLGGFKKLLLGSVAGSVSQHSTCPVLIVK